MSGDNKKSDNVALKAGVWYVASSVIVRAISVITTPIFTRLLSTAEYGTVSTFTSWYNLLLTFYTMNLTYSIGRAKLEYESKLDEYIGSMQTLSGIVSLILSVIIVAFVEPISRIFELSIPATVLLAIYLFFAPAIQFYQNGYRYRYKYKQNIAIAWYTTVGTVLLSLLFVITHDSNKAEWRMFGIVLPTVLLSCAFGINSIRKNNINFNRSYWKYGLSLSGPLIIHTLSLNILSQSDRVFISKICGAEDTALYSLVYSYSLLLSIVMNAISDGWLPWFHDNLYIGNKEGIKKNSQDLVILGCYIALACIGFAPEAVYILGGREYLQALPCVLPIVLGVLCQYIYTHYVNIEMHLKKTKYVSEGTIFATVLNLILNAIFIPTFGYVAAAYTTLVSYFALMIVHFIITRKKLGMKLYNDVFMFSSMIFTSIIGAFVSLAYDYTVMRILIILVGFVSFLVYFQSYLGQFIDKYIKQRERR